MPCKKNKSASGKKGRRGWTTEEQVAYLESCKPSYLAAQSTKMTGEFWLPVWEEWFQRWPAELLDKDIEKGKMLDVLVGEIKMVELFSCTMVHVSQFTHNWFISVLVNGSIITHALCCLANDDVNCWTSVSRRLRNAKTGRHTLIFIGKLN